MKRKSFLGDYVKEVVSYQWPVTGLDTCEVGFGVCEKSGLILQSTSVTPEKMIEYYSNTATYINPNHNGKPMPKKVKNVKRQILAVNDNLARFPVSVLQLGSSDGYTLSCFRNAGAKRVVGVEPSEWSRTFAIDKYGVESIAGTAEDFNLDERFELIAMTHVLEHIYNPLEVLIKVKKNLLNNGHLIIEVPLWEQIEKQPVGVLTFEHVNYFTETTLVSMLNAAGFEAVYSDKLFDLNQYPVITIVAKKSNVELHNCYCSEGEILLAMYLAKETDFWETTSKKIFRQLDSRRLAYIYGAGIHTSQLLYQLKKCTDIEIQGVIDSSPSKQGKIIDDFVVEGPKKIENIRSGSDIIISSRASEKYIRNSIKESRNDLNIIMLYSQ